ncbi:FemAB family PEP-CTERM system-associated protein [Psychrosphaera aestuarii]
MENALISVSILPPDEFAAWDKYVSDHPLSSLYHKSDWLSLIEASFGQKAYYFIAKNTDDTIVGVLPIINLDSWLFGNYMVSMPYFNYGSVLADSVAVENQLISAAIEAAQQNKVSHIQFRAIESAESLLKTMPVSTQKVNMILDLPETPELLGKAIGSKRRSQIKRPIREGVSHKFGGVELLEDFYEVFCLNMRDLGTPVYSKTFFKAILETFPDNSLLCVVYWQGKPVSTGFLMHYKDRMEIPWASTVRYANRISVNMYLYWQILSYAIENDFKQFDFGRSTVDAGTYKFKKQWGAEPLQCYWYHWVPEGGEVPNLSPSSAKFDLAIKVWQKLPLWVTKMIGPPIVRNLP